MKDSAFPHLEALVVFRPRPNRYSDGRDVLPPRVGPHLLGVVAELSCRVLRGFVEGFGAVTVLATPALSRRSYSGARGYR